MFRKNMINDKINDNIYRSFLSYLYVVDLYNIQYKNIS